MFVIQKNTDSILLFKVSSFITALFLFFQIFVVFKYPDQIQNQKNINSESVVLKSIEKIETTLRQLSNIQKKIGTEPAKNLVSEYNQLSNQFNSVTKEILTADEFKDNIELKNQTITINNKSVEFVEAIQNAVSNQKKFTVTASDTYLKLYVDLKNNLLSSTDLYNQPTILFFIGIIGFSLSALFTIALAVRSLRLKTNLVFQTESELSTFKNIINNMSEGVVVTNKYGFFTYYNQAAVDILGSNINDVHYQSSIDLIGFKNETGLQIEKNQLPFLTALQKNVTAEQEIFVQNIKNPDGIYISASNGFFANQKGETEGSVVVMKNMTHKKQLEALWNQEKQSAIDGSKKKSDFLASMSHEIRTPMNGIIGLTTLLNETPLNPEQKDYVGTVKRSAHSLLSLINDILDHSKIEAGKVDLVLENFNLRLLLKDISENFKFICSEKNIQFLINYPTNQPEYFIADSNRLRQILMNLIGNAVKFTISGHVEIALSFNQHLDSTKIQFEINDTGAGMEPNEVERLFQRFFQTKSGLKFGGTGLGLSISKQLVDLMNGTIGVKSKVNQGSTFWFELNLKNGVAIDSVQNELTMTQLENIFSGRILIAEDNLVNQKVASQYLKKLGFRTDIASNGQEAVEQFQKNKYDLIFMDCQMPIMTGYVATQKILHLQAGSSHCVPIVALTAEGTSGEKAKCFASGMNDFLNKPLVFEQLAILLQKYFKPTRPIQKKTAEILKPSEIWKLSEIKIGDQLLIEVLLKDYVSSTPALISEMKRSVENKKIEDIYMPAHTLKSSSAALSAITVSLICEKLENFSTNKNTTSELAMNQIETCQNLITQLEIAYTESVDGIQKNIFEIKNLQKVSA